MVEKTLYISREEITIKDTMVPVTFVNRAVFMQSQYLPSSLCEHQEPDYGGGLTLMNCGLTNLTVAMKHTWSSKAGRSARCSTPSKPFLVTRGAVDRKGGACRLARTAH